MDRAVAEAPPAAARDGEEAVDPPERGDAGAHGVTRLALVRKVGGAEGRPPPDRDDPVRELAAVVLVPRRDEDRRPLGGEAPSRRGGDPGRPGDET